MKLILPHKFRIKQFCHPFLFVFFNSIWLFSGKFIKWFSFFTHYIVIQILKKYSLSVFPVKDRDHLKNGVQITDLILKEMSPLENDRLQIKVQKLL